MFYSSPLKPKSQSTKSTTPTNASRNHRYRSGGRDDDDGAALSFLVILISLLRFVKLPFRRLQMSSKSLLPSYQDQAVGFGGAHHHHPRHSKHHHHSPSRRKKGRCVPRLSHVIYFLVTLLFIFYVTDCLHLYKRISLKKDNGRIHLQTTTYNFRFSRGPIDFSMGSFRRKDWVEINVTPE